MVNILKIFSLQKIREKSTPGEFPLDPHLVTDLPPNTADQPTS